jgi:hypothetical protein
MRRRRLKRIQIFHFSFDIFHWSLQSSASLIRSVVLAEVVPRINSAADFIPPMTNEKCQISTVPTLVEQNQLFAEIV